MRDKFQTKRITRSHFNKNFLITQINILKILACPKSRILKKINKYVFKARMINGFSDRPLEY